MEGFWTHQAVLVFLGAAVAVQLDVAFGFAGIWVFALSLTMEGGALSYAVLAKTAALTSPTAFLLAIILGAGLGSVMGLMYRRLRGDDFFVVTLGLAEGLRQFVLAGPQILGGATGIFEVPRLSGLHISRTTEALLFSVLLLAGSLGWASWIRTSPIRWLLRASDVSPKLFAALGHSFGVHHLLLVVAAATGAATGAVTAVLTGYAGIDRGGPVVDVLLYAAVILGGVRTVFGAPLGAAIVLLLPAGLLATNIASAGATQHHLKAVLFGATLLGLLIFLPDGLTRGWRGRGWYLDAGKAPAKLPGGTTQK